MPLIAYPQTAAKREALVLGSFLNRAYADERRLELESSLNIQVFIVETDVRGNAMFRVILIPNSEYDLSALRAQAAAVGVPDAWATTLSGTGFSSQVLLSDQPQTLPQPTQIKRSLARPAVAARPEDETRERKRPSSTASTSTSIASSSIGPIQLSTEGPEVDITLAKFNEGEFDFKLDGRLEEEFWQQLPSYDNLLVTDPDTMGPTRHATTQRFFYTDKGLYIGVHMAQPPETLLPRLSSRDEFLNRDSWQITLDTSGDGLYGYWFAVNLGGSVQDGKVAAERQFSSEWDGPWTSATAELADGWSAELFLPWSMMSMPAGINGERNLGFYLSRKVAYLDER
ncbi:MAG: hypothetical protein P8L31_11035 [Pseudomonadales bacterium]|nr:hypothetical protein [Pseudomonadales bacterium]